MNTIVATTPDAIADLVQELRTPLVIPEGHISVRVLAETDAFYEEPVAVRTIPASEIRQERVPVLRAALEAGTEEWSQFVRLYNLTGERLESRTGDWDSMLEALPGPVLSTQRHFRATPNAVALHDDLIYISQGHHLVAGVEIDEDGIEQFTFLSYNGYVEKQIEDDRTRQAEFMAEHGAPIAAAKPAWAEEEKEYNNLANFDGTVGVNYSSEMVGGAYITQSGEYNPTTRQVTLEPPIICHGDSEFTTAVAFKEHVDGLLAACATFTALLGGE